MPNRTIYESSRRSPDLRNLSDAAERLWWRLITTVDDFGRFEADPEVLLHACFQRIPPGWTAAKVQRCLHELTAIQPESRQPLLFLYAVKGRWYLQLTNPEPYLRRRAEKSKFPEPPASMGVREEPSPAVAGNCQHPLSSADTCLQPSTSAANAALLRDPSVEIRDPRSELPASLPDGDGRFDEFWQTFPPRDGKKLERAETRRRFLALSPADQALAVQAARTYARSLVTSGLAAKDPKRFLRDGRGNEPWRDWIDPPPAEIPVPTSCVWKVPNGDGRLHPCGQAVAPQDRRPPRPYCLEHLAAQAQLERQLASGRMRE